MILYRVSTPPFTERLVKLIKKTEQGEAYVEDDDGMRRWIPADWIMEEE